MSSGGIDGIMLIGFGGPRSPEEIRPFLDRVLRGRPVSPERYEEVVRHYQMLGGRSPYNELTMRQAELLRQRLRDIGHALPVAVGLRNSAPSFADALSELAARGARRVLGFVLAAHRCEASWDRYIAEVSAASAELGASAPRLEFLPPWHDHPLFIAASSDRVREALEPLEPASRTRAILIFTAHSIPRAMAAAAPYVAQLGESARAIAATVGVAAWRLAYQSRSGNPREPWLEPEIDNVLRELDPERPAVVIPLGFLIDHIEVLYDLDIQARRAAAAAGVRMERARTVGDHPQLIEMIATLACVKPTLQP